MCGHCNVCPSKYGLLNVDNKHKRIPKQQSKMDNPEKLDTQDEENQYKNTTHYMWRRAST
jgi:hypothetical protein